MDKRTRSAIRNTFSINVFLLLLSFFMISACTSKTLIFSKKEFLEADKIDRVLVVSQVGNVDATFGRHFANSIQEAFIAEGAEVDTYQPSGNAMFDDELDGRILAYRPTYVFYINPSEIYRGRRQIYHITFKSVLRQGGATVWQADIELETGANDRIGKQTAGILAMDIVEKLKTDGLL